MYTEISFFGSLLTCSLFSVNSAAGCFSVLGSTGSYSPTFISWSCGESDLVSISDSASLVGLVTFFGNLFKVL